MKHEEMDKLLASVPRTRRPNMADETALAMIHAPRATAVDRIQAEIIRKQRSGELSRPVSNVNGLAVDNETGEIVDKPGYNVSWRRATKPKSVTKPPEETVTKAPSVTKVSDENVTKSSGRPKRYETPSERQKAYRERRKK